MSEELFDKEKLAIMRICYIILTRDLNKPLNECAKNILDVLQNEFGYIPRPKLELIGDDEIWVAQQGNCFWGDEEKGRAGCQAQLATDQKKQEVSNA